MGFILVISPFSSLEFCGHIPESTVLMHKIESLWFYAETFWKPEHSRLLCCQGTCPRRLEGEPRLLPALLTAVNRSVGFLLFFFVVLKPPVGRNATAEPHSQPLIYLSNGNRLSIWLEIYASSFCTYFPILKRERGKGFQYKLMQNSNA